MNIDKEWDFIRAEVHGEKPNTSNRLKRETLFAMQIFLSNIFMQDYYYKLKKIYSKM